MRGIGSALGVFHSEQQQHLIAAIGCRVNRFRQHRTRTGYRGRRAFGNQDTAVGAQRVQHRAQ